MKIDMTEALRIDLDSEMWECRKCGHVHGPANVSYKRGLVVKARDPADIHRPIIDPDRYDHTFAPKAEWVSIVEYYCPGCALLVEAEYLPPGHPPLDDMRFDLDDLRRIAARKAGGTQPAEGTQ